MINQELSKKFEELKKKNPNLCYRCFKHEGKKNIMKRTLRIGGRTIYKCKACENIKG